MWDLDFVRFHLHRGYIGVLLIIVIAAVLGGFVAFAWRAEYSQCLAVSGGIHKILAGTCAASLP